MSEVSLTEFEVWWASLVGTRRQVESLRKGLSHKAGLKAEDNDFSYHIIGALAELALAKALNLYWPGSVNTFKEPDVHIYHVRWTSNSKRGLIVRPHDPDGIYVLVTGNANKMTVHGYAHSSEIKDNKYLSSPDPTRPPCYELPRGLLKPINTLKENSNGIVAPSAK